MRQRHLIGIISLALAMLGCQAEHAPHHAPAGSALPHEEERAVIIQKEPLPIARQMEGQTGIIRLVATDQGFVPPSLSVRAEGRVKIHLVNRGSRQQNLIIPRYGIVTSAIPPGAENYIEFTAGERGSWPFFSDAAGGSNPTLYGNLNVK